MATTVTETTTESGIKKTVRKTDKIGITPGNTSTEYDFGDGKILRTVTRDDWSAVSVKINRKLAESAKDGGEDKDALLELLQEIWETIEEDELHVCGVLSADWVADNWWPEDAGLYRERSTKQLGAVVRAEYTYKSGK